MIIFFKYFLIFLIYAFLGWVMEMIVCFFYTKKVVNRGFLVGPYCPIYGYGSLFIILLLGKYKNDPLALFVMSVVMCSILEYFTSYVMEKLFKARWWDYSDKKFHLNGRICLDNLIAFGALGLCIFYVINPFVLKILNMLNDNLLIILSSILLVIYIIDTIISFKVISGFKNVAKSVNVDSTEEITKKVREILMLKGWLYKRLVKAFNFIPSAKLIQELKKKAAETIEKGTGTAKKVVKVGTETAVKVVKTGADSAKKTIVETKKKIKKVSDKNEKNK